MEEDNLFNSPQQLEQKNICKKGTRFSVVDHSNSFTCVAFDLFCSNILTPAKLQIKNETFIRDSLLYIL
jgi:hypothetical protein